MGLDFFKQYGGRRYVSDAQVYRDMSELLTADLKKATKQRDDLLIVIRAVTRQPARYEEYFRAEYGNPQFDICRLMRDAGRKLFRACLEIERINKALGQISENARRERFKTR